MTYLRSDPGGTREEGNEVGKEKYPGRCVCEQVIVVISRGSAPLGSTGRLQRTHLSVVPPGGKETELFIHQLSLVTDEVCFQGH